MKILTAALSVTMLIGMLVAGGCVSQEEYNKVVTMNRKAVDARKQAEQDLEAARAANQKLESDLAVRDQIIASNKNEIALLDEQNRTLLAENKRLNDLLNKGGPDVGPTIVLPGALNDALIKLAKENSDLFDYYPEYGMVKIKADMTFDKGSAEVNAGAREALRKLAEIANSPTARPFNIYIAGHTDDIPIKRPETLREHKDNWQLSAHRAIGVAKVLFEANVAPERMGVIGFSKYHPIAPNAPGNKGNPANRRVEIWLVPSDRFLTGTGMEVKSSPTTSPDDAE